MTNHPPSVLWHCWLGHQTCKNRRPYNLYCVGADVNHAQSNLRLSGVVVNTLADSHPSTATILLGSNLGQVVYSHCLPSLLSYEKLGYKKVYSDWINLTA